MQSKAATVAEYLSSLPADRRAALQAVREVILANLDRNCQECVQYGMIGYCVPHSVYPPGYHCDPKQPLPFAGLASQKNHMAIYLMCIYGSPQEEAWFRAAWAKTGRKLDMGKSCIRFKRLEDVALDVLGEALRRTPAAAYIARYEASLQGTAQRRSATKKPSAAGAKRARTAAVRPAKKSPAPAAKKGTKKSARKTARKTR